MDIERTVKFFIFALLALLPITFGFIFFDYSKISKLQLVNDFGIQTSLIAIAILYTGVAIIIRILMYYILGFLKDKNLIEIIKESTFLNIFYVSCVDVLIYSSIPIILTFSLDGNFIHFIGNSLIIWGIIFIIWIILLIKYRNRRFI